MAFGFLKKIAKGAGKVLGGVGDVVSKAAPLAGLIPGVGTLAGGIIGGAGGLLGNLNNKNVSLGSVFGNTLKGGLGGAAGGLANKALLGGKGIGGLVGLLKGGGGGVGGAPVQQQNDMYASLVGSGMDPQQAARLAHSTAQGGGIQQGLGSLFSNPATLAKLGIAGAGLLSGSQSQGKANQISDELLQQNRAMDASRGRLRGLFEERLGQLPNKPKDLSGVFKSSNPFARTAY